MKISPALSAAFRLLLLLCLLAGCRKKPEEPQDLPPESPAEESVERVTMRRNGESESEEPPPQESVSPPPPLEAIPPFSGPLYLQRILPRSRILPDGDYSGPFMDFMSTDPEENQVGVLIRSFFQAYRDGILDERYLSSRRNPLFQEELELFLPAAGEISGYFVGSFTPSGARASVRIRLLSGSGSIKGVLYLVKSEDLWTIEDWELPLFLWPGETQEESGEDRITD